MRPHQTHLLCLLSLISSGVSVSIKSVSLTLDSSSPSLEDLRAQKAKLEEDVHHLQSDLLHENRGVLGVVQFNQEAYDILSYTLGSIGAAVGLVLLFGGVRLPRTSTLFSIFYGFGAVGFSLLWFGVTYDSQTHWYTPLAVSYTGGTIVGLLFTLAVALHPVGSSFVSMLLGGVAGLVFGIMLNTVGFFTFVSATTQPYFMFSIMSGSCFLLGMIVYLTLAVTKAVEKRYLSMWVYCFVGAYLLVKGCGIGASQYPNEWGALYFDDNARQWEYYLMFAATFITAALAATFQFFVYRIGPDDEYADGGVITAERSHYTSKKGMTMWEKDTPPSHASMRKMRTSREENEEPGFGSAYVPPIGAAGPSQQGYEKYASHF